MHMQIKTYLFAVTILGLTLTLMTLTPAPIAFSKEKLAGISLANKVPVILGKDLGFGKKFNPSLQNNYQDWGVQKVSRVDGFPVRLGEYSIRFETREGVCGWAGKIWNDCKNG